jgi:hypothetical protein
MSADGSWSVCTHEHLTIRSLRYACYSATSCQQMVHGVFALMNICQIVVFSMRLLLLSCQQMVHGVFALMNICQIVVLCYALATAPVMSADGSSVCTEHLIHRCSLDSCACHSTSSCRQMVHGVFALMNICLIADLRYALAASVQIISRWFMECLHS